MDGTLETNWSTWKVKRRNTLFGFIIIGIVVGIDGSILFSTLFLYLKDMVKTDKPELYYGIIIAVFYVASAISGALNGRWLDKTRKIRYYTNFSLWVQFIGIMLYIIPYNVAFPLFGRLLCGIGEPFTNVVTGEVIRIYGNDESNRALLWMAAMYSMGFIIGPGINFLFKGIEFTIGPLQVNYLNFIGIIMAGLILITLIISNFLIHDCSAEIDLKEIYTNTSNESIGMDTNDVLLEEVDNNTETTQIIPKHSDEQTTSVKLVMKKLASNLDTLLIFIATFILVYAECVADLYIPLLITIYMGWGITATNISYVGYGITYFFLLLLLSKYFTSNRNVYYVSLASIVSNIFSSWLLISFKFLERDFTRDVVMLILFITSLSLAWCIEDVLIRIMLAKLLPSHIQSFGETLRAGISKVAMIFASLTVSVVTPWLHWWAGGMSIIVFLLLVVFIFRKRSFIHPKEINFSEK